VERSKNSIRRCVQYKRKIYKKNQMYIVHTIGKKRAITTKQRVGKYIYEASHIIFDFGFDRFFIFLRTYLNITSYTIQFVDKILIYKNIRYQYRLDVLSTVARWLMDDMRGGFARIHSSPIRYLRTYCALSYVCTTKVCAIIVFRTLSGNTVMERFPPYSSVFESRRARVFRLKTKKSFGLQRTVPGPRIWNESAIYALERRRRPSSKKDFSKST